MLSVKLFDSEPSPTPLAVLTALGLSDGYPPEGFVAPSPQVPDLAAAGVETAAELESLRTALATMGPVGVELSDYRGGRFAAVRDALLSMHPSRKSMHVAHNVCALLDLTGPNARARAQALSEGVSFARLCGVRGGAVIHVERTEAVLAAAPAGSKLPGTRPDLGGVMSCARQAASLLRGIGPLFIENTFEPLEWFAELADRVIACAQKSDRDMDTTPIGLCLDVGHTRLWGGKRLSSWVDVCERAAAAGVRVHAHLHWNEGVDDDHEPLSVAAGRGVLDCPAGEWAPEAVLPELRRLVRIVGEDHAVLENTMAGCLKNLSWALSALA